MSKEELRKEFLCLIDGYLPNEQRERLVFDWFYSKLEEKDQEIATHKLANSLLLDSDSEADLANKIYQLEAKLKAADEVILQTYNYSAKKENTLEKAVEHYKSLKQ